MRLREAVGPNLNITPLVDVLLILCVLLIVAAPMASNRLPVDPPVAMAAVGGVANHWIIGFDGKAWYLNERAVAFSVIERTVPKGASIALAAEASLAYSVVMQAVDRVHQVLKPAEFSLATR